MKIRQLLMPAAAVASIVAAIIAALAFIFSLSDTAPPDSNTNVRGPVPDTVPSEISVHHTGTRDRNSAQRSWIGK